MKGWKTVALGLLMAILPSAVTYLGNVDWPHLIGPNAAFIVSGALVIVLRYVTTTPIGQK